MAKIIRSIQHKIKYDKDRKALEKLLFNVLYSNTMENSSNKSNIKLIIKKDAISGWTSKPSFISQKKSLVNIKLQYVKVKLQQYLINHGDVHLNLNKVLMYQFHYDYIKEE